MTEDPRNPLATDPGNAEPIRHLNKAELAARWKLSTRTLERWRSEGYGPAWMTIGGSIRYRLADVLAYEARHRSEGRA